MITTMKKILLILLLIMPSVVMLADGPQYKFLRGVNAFAARQSNHATQNANWASVNVNNGVNAGSRAVNYNDVFRTSAPSTGRSLVSSEISITTENADYNVSGTGASTSISLGRKSEGITATHGSAITAVFSKSAPEVITLGHGKLAATGGEIRPDAGTAQPPATAHTPIGDAMVPMLLMALAFAAFKFKKH